MRCDTRDPQLSQAAGASKDSRHASSGLPRKTRLVAQAWPRLPNMAYVAKLQALKQTLMSGLSVLPEVLGSCSITGSSKQPAHEAARESCFQPSKIKRSRSDTLWGVWQLSENVSEKIPPVFTGP